MSPSYLTEIGRTYVGLQQTAIQIGGLPDGQGESTESLRRALTFTGRSLVIVDLSEMLRDGSDVALQFIVARNTSRRWRCALRNSVINA
jgi:hypothetical protein